MYLARCVARGRGGLSFYLPPSRANGLSGGLDPPSAECPQPVHTDERDALRNELRWAKSYWAHRPPGQHWHEGHPDVRAWLADLVPRAEGLYNRPKLLRCSAEARRKARAWASTFNSVMATLKGHPHLKGIASARGQTVIPKGGMTVKTLNMRNYHFRYFGRWTDEFHQSGAESAKPAAVPSSVVGVPFDPRIGGAGGDPTKSGANRVTALQRAAIEAGILQPGAAVPTAGGAVPFPGVTSGEFFGIPTEYLIYGGLGLVAWRMMKGR